MTPARRSGILLHPTSLPGAWGIGDFGDEALQLLDWLHQAGQTLWQVLPLGPVGPGGSPYSSPSTFAGSPLLISPTRLSEEGLLPPGALDVHPDFESQRVDYVTVAEWKDALLRVAWRHARRESHRELVDEARSLAESPGYESWLPDWALYAALKRRFEGRDWLSWPQTYRMRERTTLDVARRELEEEIHFQYFCQLLWSRQWDAVRQEAHDRGIRIVGDLPIYPALDSADVWANRDLFELDNEGRPRSLGGVPPDAYSEDGQSWGVPVYDWDRCAETGFTWWIERLRATLSRTDLVRLDHFRGYVAYWRIPEGADSARAGSWRAGPGAPLFRAARAALGEVPLVAEDLGDISPDVHDLRRALDLPPTRVLQFAFEALESEHLPHRVDPDTFFYSGTHDNSTTAGWLATLGEEARDRVVAYTGTAPGDGVWGLLRAVSTSVAAASIFPLQDVLGLDDSARMNRPGIAEGNWNWRLSDLPDRETTNRLQRLTETSGRLPRTDGDP